MQQFQIVFLPDHGISNPPYYYDHIGSRESTVEVLRQGHMDSWYADDSHVGYEDLIAANGTAIQKFAAGNGNSVFIVVPFGQLCAFNCGSR